MEKKLQDVAGQTKIFNCIKSYISVYGYPPSIREICTLTGIASSSSVHYHLKRMIRDGTLETDHPSAPRAIRIPGMKIVFPEKHAKESN